MAKQFYFYFGTGNPSAFTGLSPTFTVFSQNGTTGLQAPGITETVVGSGIYGFNYGTTASIAWVIDGGATLTNSAIRYLVGALDPVMGVDQSIGFATDSFGTTITDPTTLYGQANRNQEFNEGNKIFLKSSGLWDIYSRGASGTLLREKQLTNTVTSATSS